MSCIFLLVYLPLLIVWSLLVLNTSNTRESIKHQHSCSLSTVACFILEILIIHLPPQWAMAVNVTTVCCFHILFGHVYHQIPSKHPRSQAEVLVRIFPGIFLRMPLIYESCWQLGDISLCLSSQVPLLLLPHLSTSPRNVTLYKAVCPLFIVGHRGDTVTFIYSVPYGDKSSWSWLPEADFKLCQSA